MMALAKLNTMLLMLLVYTATHKSYYKALLLPTFNLIFARTTIAHMAAKRFVSSHIHRRDDLYLNQAVSP